MTRYPIRIYQKSFVWIAISLVDISGRHVMVGRVTTRTHSEKATKRCSALAAVGVVGQPNGTNQKRVGIGMTINAVNYLNSYVMIS